METIIEVSELRKRYGATVAVDGISLSVQAGEILGIVGPNGAGKTTTVECLEGLRRPDGGEVRVLGLDPRRQGAQLRQRIGVQLQQAALPDRLKVWEALDLYAAFYRDPADWRRLLEEWGLQAKARRRLRRPLRRPASATVHRPGAGRPARGGVPRRAHHRPGPPGPQGDLGAGQAGPGPRAPPWCWSPTSWRRPSFSATGSPSSTAGRVVALDTPSALVRGLRAGQRLRFRPLTPFDPNGLRALPGVERVDRDRDQVVVTGDGPLLATVAAALADRAVPVADLRTEEASLEDAFLALTGRALRD